MKYAHSALPIRLLLSVVVATSADVFESSPELPMSRVTDVSRTMAVADVELMTRQRYARQLAVELARGLDLVGQRRADLVEAVPLGRAGVARRPIEEEVVAYHRPANSDCGRLLGGQELIAEGAGPYAGRKEIVRQRVARHQRFRQPIEADASGKLVGAAPADGVLHRSGRAAELGRDSRANQVYLGDVEGVNLGAKVAECRVRDVRPINQVSVVLAPAAGRGADRAAIVGHAGYQLKQASIRTLQRQRFHRSRVDVEADLRRSHVDNRTGGRDDECLGDG
jgi:hypothetical protein